VDFFNLAWIRMTSDTSSINDARAAWMAVLARATLTQLQAHVPQDHTLQPMQQVRPPEVGMVMLRGRIGGTGDPFNLGEASVVRCAVRIGNGPLGVSYGMGRDKRRCELAALFDALLQDPQHHAHLHRALIAPLALAQAQARAQTQLDVVSSKVEFFTFVRGEA
jgi:alpha-D-ribose 1-methylphosphonate 5-triphosphate synthase subunit PhnG